MNDTKRLRSTRQASAELNHPRDELYLLVRLGLVPSVLSVGKALAWPDAALQEARQALARQCQPA